MMKGARKRCAVSFLRALIPFIKAQPPDLTIPTKAASPNTCIGVRFSIVRFGGRDIYSVEVFLIMRQSQEVHFINGSTEV